MKFLNIALLVGLFVMSTANATVIGNVVDYKSISAAGAPAKDEIVEVVYDFAKDGGAAGEHALFVVPEGHVVLEARMHVDTAVVGSSSTVSVGKSGDLAGIIAATAEASLTAGAVIFNVAPDNASNKLAAAAVVYMSIGTADLTAGKIRFQFRMRKF